MDAGNHVLEHVIALFSDTRSLYQIGGSKKDRKTKREKEMAAIWLCPYRVGR